METKYYDIGLNLFTRSFPDPEKIIRNAEEAGVRCRKAGRWRRKSICSAASQRSGRRSSRGTRPAR